MPDGVPPAVAKSFLALIPGFCVLAVVLALRLAVEASPFGDINSMIATLIGIPMHHVGGTLPGMIISVILIGILWTLGLHGDAIVLVFIQPVWLSNMSENLTAFQNGQPIPHIITQQFYDLWIAPGGTGALLGLVIFYTPWNYSLAAPSQLTVLANVLLTGYVLPFEIAAVLLLAAMIGAASTVVRRLGRPRLNSASWCHSSE